MMGILDLAMDNEEELWEMLSPVLYCMCVSGWGLSIWVGQGRQTVGRESLIHTASVMFPMKETSSECTWVQIFGLLSFAGLSLGRMHDELERSVQYGILWILEDRGKI